MAAGFGSDCPPGRGQNVGAEAVLGLLLGLVGFGKGRSVVLLSFSFIHETLVELLLSASDAAGRPPLLQEHREVGRAPLQALGGS